MNEILLFLFLFVVLVIFLIDDVVVIVDSKNLPLKSGQNRVTYR